MLVVIVLILGRRAWFDLNGFVHCDRCWALFALGVLQSNVAQPGFVFHSGYDQK
jgi:hypothetical protein